MQSRYGAYTENSIFSWAPFSLLNILDPTDAALKFWLFAVFVNHIQYGIGFILTKPLNMSREYGIDI